MPALQVKHVLSHRIIYAVFYRIDIPEDEQWENPGLVEIPAGEIRSFPVSRLVHKYIEAYY
jgi:A/G-specific adenine glycosylase